MRPFAAELMRVWPISTRVNRGTNLLILAGGLRGFVMPTFPNNGAECELPSRLLTT
jgi:hypothetical protein